MGTARGHAVDLDDAEVGDRTRPAANRGYSLSTFSLPDTGISVARVFAPPSLYETTSFGEQLLELAELTAGDRERGSVEQLAVLISDPGKRRVPPADPLLRDGRAGGRRRREVEDLGDLGEREVERLAQNESPASGGVSSSMTFRVANDSDSRRSTPVSSGRRPRVRSASARGARARRRSATC